MAHVFSREKLFDLIWEQPRTVLAKQLGISDVALGKLCSSLDIPSPPRGYWAKKEAGKRVLKPSLTVRGFGQPDEIIIGRPDRSGGRMELLEPPVFTEKAEELQIRADKIAGSIKAQTLNRPHPLVSALLEEDNRRRQEKEAKGYAWREPRFDSTTAKRRLKLVNRLFQAFTFVGCTPTVRSRDPLETGVKVGTMHLGLKIEEMRRAESIRLKITVSTWKLPYSPRTVWMDEEHLALEQQITDIAASVLVLGEMQYRANRVHHYHWLSEHRKAAEEKIRLAREQEEQERIAEKRRKEQAELDWLLLHACNLRKAADIRAPVAALAGHPDLECNPTLTAEFEKWKQWALSQAAALDPLLRPLNEVVNQALLPGTLNDRYD